LGGQAAVQIAACDRDWGRAKRGKIFSHSWKFACIPLLP